MNLLGHVEPSRALVACDARSDAVLRQLVARRRWEEALDEAARLAALDPERGALAELRARVDRIRHCDPATPQRRSASEPEPLSTLRLRSQS